MQRPSDQTCGWFITLARLAIPGIRAKPILDLIPVIVSLAELDKFQGRIKMLGYDWWDELGLPGRRYCTKSDPKTGHRTVQLHCNEDGSTEITRHLAFRDYLRAHPELAVEYEQVKMGCQGRLQMIHMPTRLQGSMDQKC